MNAAVSTDPVDRLLRRQIKLFEHAHKKPLELKSFGLTIKREGIDTSKLYCNPSYLMLPLKECPRLSALRQDQLSVLTATFFARTYAEIASSETVALTYNQLASARVFPVYSDEYMVLFHETAEEYDHIITFRAVCQGLVGRGDVVGIDRFEHLKSVPSMMERYNNRLDDNGWSALYLLTRYMLNVALKQIESFMAKGLDPEKASPLALDIIAGHSEDEARHTTTSLELGLGLYRRASEQSRKVVAGALRVMIYSMIDRHFSNDSLKTWTFGASFGVLALALAHPAFAGFGMTAEELRASWQRDNIPVVMGPEVEASRRWLAAELRRLSEGLEITLTPHGEPFEHYVEYARAA